MCKKLKVVTRGHTKYHESMENFLDSQIYSLEEEKEAAPSGNGKSLKDIWASKSAWYIKIWESIKHIFSKIVDFFKGLVQKFVDWWNRKHGNSEDNVKELESIANDQEAMKRLNDWFETADWEHQSEDGYIPVSKSVIENLKNQLNGFIIVCQKFTSAVNETVNSNKMDPTVYNHVNEMNSKLCEFLSISAPPKFTNGGKELST